MRVAADVVKQLKPGSVDTVLFTVGIVNGNEKKTSAEGIELDTAVSFLSRFVMTTALLKDGSALRGTPTRKPRVFVMGFPGAPDTPQLDDFNWDTSWKSWHAHMNSVLGNDALVLGIAEQQHPAASFNIFGLNPGIIATDLMFDFCGGQDSPFHRLQKTTLSAVAPSVEEYTNAAVHLLVSPQIEGESGASFNQRGERIRSCPWNLAERGNVRRIWVEAEQLAQRALQGKLL
eukprot:3872204-Rhodomonas_salina.3